MKFGLRNKEKESEPVLLLDIQLCDYDDSVMVCGRYANAPSSGFIICQISKEGKAKLNLTGCDNLGLEIK